MPESKDERTKRYARKIEDFPSAARESRNEGQAVKAYNAALRVGSTTEASKELKRVLDELVLITE